MGNATKFNQDLGHTDHETHSLASMRALDLCAGVILVILFFPSMVLLALTTMAFNKGRGFRRVSKVTQDGHFVTVLNFHASNRSDSSGFFNRFMVNSRLAKLPEIFNVVTGELSLFNSAYAKPALFFI